MLDTLKVVRLLQSLNNIAENNMRHIMTVTLEMNWDTKSMIIPTSIIVNWFYLPSEIMEMVSYVEWLKEHMFSRLKGQITGAGFQSGWKKGCVQKSGKQAHWGQCRRRRQVGQTEAAGSSSPFWPLWPLSTAAAPKNWPPSGYFCSCLDRCYNNLAVKSLDSRRP